MRVIRQGFEQMEFIPQPSTTNRLGEFLLENLRKDWSIFRAAVAFVKQSGTKHVVDELLNFSKHGVSDLMVGINHRGTSKEGLEHLLEGVGSSGRVVVVNNPLAYTFHPKIYVFRSSGQADVLIGSGNLTEGGIYTNYEASVRLRLELSNASHADFLKKIEGTLDAWADLSKGCARLLDRGFLNKLVARGDVPVEALVAIEDGIPDDDEVDDDVDGAAEDEEQFFDGQSLPRAPSATRRRAAAATGGASSPRLEATGEAVTTNGNRGFVMVLQNTDVGKGQTTSGTSARSPEIFIPLKARDADPDFWGWPDKFVESPTKYDREGVKMSFGGAQDITVNIMGWKLKKDLRLRHESLRSGGAVGDILRMEKAPSGSGVDYIVEIVKKGTTMHPVYLARCTEAVRNSFKTFGYY